MNINIELVKEEFAEKFRNCLNQVAQERSHLLITQAPPLEKVQEFLKSNIENNVPQLFVFDDDKLIGWSDIKPFEHETLKHRAELGMGLLKEYRGQGLGKRLLVESLKVAKDRGIEIVCLEVFSNNKAAIKLYESLGFSHEGLLKKYRKLDGAYEDCVCMSIEL